MSGSIEMNLDKTVFILGAGASLPYGYPTARGLRNDIINKFRQVLTDCSNYLNKDQFILNDVIEILVPIIKQFEESNTESIDLFLTRTEDQSKITTGTQLIWLFIFWYEHNFVNNKTKIEPSNDWYFDFYNRLTEGITSKSKLGELENSQINFITFNYDRSLENYLFESFKNAFTLGYEQTTELIYKSFNFYHVYGKIINLSWEKTDPKTAYGSKSTPFYLDHCKNNIRMIYNERDKISLEMQELIKQAKRIFILGFGFADVNLQVLNLKEILTQEHIIYASGIGLHPSRIEQIQLSLSKREKGIKKHNIYIESDMNNLELLKNYLF